MMKNTRQANFWENYKKYLLHKYGIEILLGNYLGNHSTFNSNKGKTFGRIATRRHNDDFDSTDPYQREPSNVKMLVQSWEVLCSGPTSGKFLYK